MTISPSQVRIGNRALILLGSVERLTSFEDPTPLAGQIKDLWYESRRTALAEHPWNFAIKRALLNESGDAPPFGWSRQFRLPADCLRWLPFARDEDSYYEAEMEGAALLTDAAAPLPFRYIADIEAVTSWPPHFVTFMATSLACDLANSATQFSYQAGDMQAKRDAELQAAKEVDALASGARSTGKVEIMSRWVGSRSTPQRPILPQDR